MRFIYILVGLFFIGCQSQTSIPSKNKIDKLEERINAVNTDQSTDRIDELEKMAIISISQSTNRIDELEKRIDAVNTDQSTNRIDELEKRIDAVNTDQSTNRIDELEKRIEIYKVTYDGTVAYLKGVRNKDPLSTKKAINKFETAIRYKKNDYIYGERKNPIISGDKGYTYGKVIGDYRQSFTVNFNLNYYLYLTLGKSYFNLCKIENTDYCEEAIKNLDSAIAILEKNPYSYKYSDPYYHKGMASIEYKKSLNILEQTFYEAIKNHKEGKKHFEKLLSKHENKSSLKKISDSEFRTHLSLAVIYLDYGTKVLHKNGRLNRNARKFLEKAKTEFLKVLIIDPEYDSAFHNLGETESRLGKYESAIKNFNIALFINPTNITSYLSRGYALLKLKKMKLACFNFNIAIKLDEKYEIQKKEIYNQLKINAQCS